MERFSFSSKVVKTNGVKHHIDIDGTSLKEIDVNQYYVYHHLKKDSNELFYVGKGIRYRAISIQNRSEYWHNVVNKHGCIVKIIKSNLSKDEAFVVECDEISKYGRLDINTGILINFTNGGEGVSGYIMSEEEKEKHRINMIGCNNHQFGIQRFGKDNPNFGNTGDKNPLSKPILCFDLNSNFIKFYPSNVSTEKDGFCSQAVNACCNNRRPQHKGYLFIYESNYDPNVKLIYTLGKTSKRKIIGINHVNKKYKIYDCINDVKIDGFAPKVVQQCCAKIKKSHYHVKWYYFNTFDFAKFEQLRYSLDTNES